MHVRLYADVRARVRECEHGAPVRLYVDARVCARARVQVLGSNHSPILGGA